MIARLSLTVLLLAAALVQAGEEKRTFSVQVDKKHAGTNQIVIETRADGTQTMTCQAEVVVKATLYTYKYTFKGSETWQGDVLSKFSTSTNDDGKKHTVAAEVGKDGLDMTADGKNFLVKGPVWTTTYWKLPAQINRGPNVTLIDADTGKIINAKFEKIGVEKTKMLNQQVDCVHYRLSEGVQVDLWYDGDDRLIRQESIEEGHKTVLEISRLQRD